MCEIPCWLTQKSRATGLAWRKARDLDHFPITKILDIGVLKIIQPVTSYSFLSILEVKSYYEYTKK